MPCIAPHAVAVGSHYSDTFTRADAATLGANWTNEVAAQFTLHSNQASVPGSALTVSQWVSPMSTNNVKVTATVGTHHTGERFQLFLRSSNAHQILAWFDDANNTVIGTHTGTYATAASYTEVDVVASATGGLSPGDILSFEANGPIYIARKNGAILTTWADNYATPKYPHVDSSHMNVAIGVSGGGFQDGWVHFTADDIAPTAGDGSIMAFDISTGTTGPTQSWFNSAFASGYKLFICDSTNVDRTGAHTGWAFASQQCGYALNAGMKIAAYGRAPADYSIGINACAPYVSNLQFWTLDVEDVGSPVTPAMITGVQGLGVRPLIYSGNWAWAPVMGSDVTTYSAAGIPLWDSADDTLWSPNFTPTNQVPVPGVFGGWNTPSTMRVGVQQCLDVTLNGQLIDVSSFNPAFLV